MADEKDNDTQDDRIGDGEDFIHLMRSWTPQQQKMAYVILLNMRLRKELTRQQE